MAIIVGDIHGNVEKVKAWLAYKPEELHVALGDYLDSFNEPRERQLQTLELLLGSDAVLLWGNHDLHYLDGPLFQFPGYSYANANTFRPILEGNLSRFKAAYVVDGWLCTHAGVHAGIAKDRSVEQLEQQFNDDFDVYLRNRDAGYKYQAIFSFDFMAEGKLVPASIKQVFGHDHHCDAGYINQVAVAIGCSDEGSLWVFDTKAGEVIDLWQS